MEHVGNEIIQTEKTERKSGSSATAKKIWVQKNFPFLYEKNRAAHVPLWVCDEKTESCG